MRSALATGWPRRPLPQILAHWYNAPHAGPPQPLRTFSVLRQQPPLRLQHVNCCPPRHRCNSTQNAVDEQVPVADQNTTSTSSENLSKRDQIAARKEEQPSYQLTFTCRKCLHRSTHRMSKQAYHFGTTLITCPGCKNRHLISDHLKIFSDERVTLEDIIKENGQFLKKGRLGDDGEVEFYDESQLPEQLKSIRDEQGPSRS